MRRKRDEMTQGEYMREMLCRVLDSYRRTHSGVEDGMALALDAVNAMHTADVEPVVRCPECKYHHDCGTHFCDRLGMDCPDDSEFFRKYGAKMDGAE